MLNVKKKKILLITGFAESLINFRGDFIKKAISEGYQVEVAAPKIDNKIISSTLYEWNVVCHDIFLSRTGLNPIVDIFTCLSLYRLIKKRNPTVVVAYTIKPVIYGMLASWFANIPVRGAMITGLGYAFTGGDYKGLKFLVNRLAKYLYRLSLARATTVFFQNPDDQKLFYNSSLASKEKTVLINGSGINLKHFSFRSLPAYDNIQFLFIARLLRDKGVYEYVDAARQLLKEGLSVTFHIVGWIDSNPSAIDHRELQAWINEGIITYHGRLSDVRPLICQTHVYVLPSYREGTPRTVLEAMAIGRPIITTDVPGCRETVQNGYNGLLVPAKSAIDLASAMRTFVEKPFILKEMGENSRHLAEEKYDVDYVNTVILSNLESIE